MFWTVVDSPIDSLLLVGDATGLRQLLMEPHEPPAGADRDDAALAPVTAQLAEYFAGARTRFELPLSPHGTAFQQKVWMALREIPFGRTTTYGELAAELGQPTAPAPSARPPGRNPLAIIVPCHRVIGSERLADRLRRRPPAKRSLLDHERAVLGETAPQPPGLW